MLEPTITLAGWEFRQLSDTGGQRTRVNVATVGQTKNLLITRHTEDLKALLVRDNTRWEAPLALPSDPSKVVPIVINVTIQAGLPTNATDEAAVVSAVTTGLDRLMVFYSGRHNSDGAAPAAWASADLYKALRRGEQ